MPVKWIGGFPIIESGGGLPPWQLAIVIVIIAVAMAMGLWLVLS